MAKKKSTPKKKPGFKAPVNTKTGAAGADAVSTKGDTKDKDKPKDKDKAKPADAAENPKAVTGDNILSEDQLRMVFFNHLKLRKEADADVASAEAELRAAKAAKKKVNKLIQGEGGSLVDIATALRFEDGEEKTMRAEVENRLKIARWLNIPMGFQLDLLDEDRRPAVDKAFEEGKIAGLKASPRKAPHDPSTKQYTRWLEGYAEGQAVHSRKFKPLEKTDTPVGSKPKEAPTAGNGDAAAMKMEKDAKPKEGAADGQKATPEGDKAGGPVPTAEGGVSGAPAATAGATTGTATAAPPKTPPTPPAEDGSNVVNLQTGGKKV